MSSSECVAPYEQWPGVSAAPNRYLVLLHDGYTNKRHKAVIGEGLSTGQSGPSFSSYVGTLTDDMRERVRRDPGVKKITQFGDDQWLRSRQPNTTEPGWEKAPGCIVAFADPESYSTEAHFERIGRIFNHRSIPYTGYCAEAQLEDVFSDPNVDYVEENTYGK